MKKFILFTALVSFFMACNNSGKSDETIPDTVVAVQAWEATLNDSTDKIELNKSVPDGPDSLSVDAVIRFLNLRNPNIQVQYVKQSGDTLYISIPQATYLTQQMGSTGPELFFAESVYNLTEIPGIHYVRYDFEEGDHAQPGLFSRDSFKDE